MTRRGVFLWMTRGRSTDSSICRGKQPLTQEQHILPWHQERAPCIILHTNIVCGIAQHRSHPRLRLGKGHESVGTRSQRDDKHQPQPLRAWRDVRHHNSQFLLTRFYLLPFRPWIGDVVNIVDGESAGDGLLVLPPSVLEGGMKGSDGQQFLQFPLQGFIFLLGQLAPSAPLQGILQFGTSLRHRGRIQHLVEQFGSTFPNLALDVISYSKHF